MIARAINRALKPFDRRLQCESTYQLVAEHGSALEELAALYTAAHRPAAGSVEGIVFSRDRALQLHALLRSYLAQARDAVPLRVLFKATTPEHRAAYEEVFAAFPGAPITAHAEQDFREDLLALLHAAQTERIFFLVDDNIFHAPFALADLARHDWRFFIPSLRLSGHLDNCYTRNQPQPLPPFHHPPGSNDALLYWIWAEGEHDWSFSLAVDGHLFGRCEMEIIAQHALFRSPNSFENVLQIYDPIFRGRYGVGFPQACLMNLPINRVQSEVANRHGALHQDDLLAKWRQGLQIDLRPFAGLKNKSTHEEHDVLFVPRS